MNHANTIVLEMPRELKQRLQKQAKSEGVTINQFAVYVLNHQVTYLERQEFLERRLAAKRLSSVKKRAKRILSKVPVRRVPEWDRV
jgi:predicted DNA-binding protein